MAILNNSNAISAGGYDVNNSLRFRSSASAYLSRTPASTGDRQKWTFSAWVKRGASGVRQGIFVANPSGAVYWGLEFETGNNLNIYDSNAGGTTALTTTALYRDFGAWYHVVVAVDTTQSTASNRVKLYINGTQVTAFSVANYPSQNSNTQINTGSLAHYIGNWNPSVANLPLDGYMAEVNFIDGSQKAASDFGETDATTGVWKPKAYSGTYGTNGFYLKFSDIATTSGSNAGLGKDFSGNTNYWTTNNISVTSGTTYDAMTDSPTNTSATVANYAVINPLAGSTIGTIDNANLRLYYNGANWSRQISTIGMTTGKWYAEFTISQIGDNSWQAGVTSFVPTRSSVNQNGESSGSGFLNAYQSAQSGAIIWNNTTRYNLSVVYSAGDVIGVAFDADTGIVKYYRNGSQVGNSGGYTIDNIGSPWYFQMFSKATDGTGSYGIVDANFGQRPFSYTPPTGYVALNTYNLPTPTILQGNKYMDATTYTATGTSQSITNAGGFKPDLVWTKSRSTTSDNLLTDAVRGVTKVLYSNLTDAEVTTSTYLTSFNSNGYSVGTGNYPNNTTMVGWQWQAGQGSTSSNTQGSITSTVSVNATAGFSIVTYTGSGSNATVGHGLGVAPSFTAVKCRNDGTIGWVNYHASLGNTKFLNLNSTNAAGTGSTVWNNTSPTSTTIALGTDSAVNGSTKTYVIYAWAEIAGFSKFTSYVGNGSADGPFIYTGFRPKFVIVKRTDSAQDWFMWDSARTGYNMANYLLFSNLSQAEYSGTESSVDFLSNGFKIRVGSVAAGSNASGGTYIVMAFAENPFSSNCRAR
jgi:hypothetical protein